MSGHGSIAAVLALCAGTVLAAEKAPPAEYVDKGGCPFECCTYRDWTVEKDTLLRAAPDPKSAEAGTVKAHEPVRGVTGEVHARPTHFTYKRDHEGHKRGEVLWVYSTSGEGFYGVWRNGKLDSVELGIGPDGDTGGQTCEKADDNCWGTFDHPLDMDWWVKIRRKDGSVGWSNEPDNFGNKDSCG